MEMILLKQTVVIVIYSIFSIKVYANFCEIRLRISEKKRENLNPVVIESSDDFS